MTGFAPRKQAIELGIIPLRARQTRVPPGIGGVVQSFMWDVPSELMKDPVQIGFCARLVIRIRGALNTGASAWGFAGFAYALR